MAITWGYVRVSTDDQGAGLAAQRQAVLDAGVDERHLYVDEGVSGKKMERPGLNALLEQARRSDVIICTKLDRLGRSIYGVLGLLQKMEAGGIELRVLYDQIDTTTPAGKLMRNVLLMIAEFERDMISQRTKIALAEIKRTGIGKKGLPVKIGRPEALSAENKKELHELYEDGVRITDLARYFEVTPKTIYAHLDFNGERLQREVKAKLRIAQKLEERRNVEKPAPSGNEGE